MPDPSFPKPEGGTAGATIPTGEFPADPGSGGLLLPPFEPPGADGFGIETTTQIDLTTPGSIITLAPVSFVDLDVDTWTPVLPATNKIAAHPGLGWQFLDSSYAVSARLHAMRFLAPQTRKVNRISIPHSAVGPVDNTLEFGIWNALGTVRLGSSGAVAVGAFAVPAFFTVTIPEVSLVANTQYCLAAVWRQVTVGAVANHIACDLATTTITNLNGNNVQRWISWQVDGAPNPLPVDLTSIAAPSAAASVGPYAVLWHS